MRIHIYKYIFLYILVSSMCFCFCIALFACFALLCIFVSPLFVQITFSKNRACLIYNTTFASCFCFMYAKYITLYIRSVFSYLYILLYIHIYVHSLFKTTNTVRFLLYIVFFFFVF